MELSSPGKNYSGIICAMHSKNGADAKVVEWSEICLAQVPSGTFCIVQSKGSADRCCIMSDDSDTFVLHSFEWGESMESYLHWGNWQWTQCCSLPLTLVFLKLSSLEPKQNQVPQIPTAGFPKGLCQRLFLWTKLSLRASAHWASIVILKKGPEDRKMQETLTLSSMNQIRPSQDGSLESPGDILWNVENFQSQFAMQIPNALTISTRWLFLCMMLSGPLPLSPTPSTPILGCLFYLLFSHPKSLGFSKSLSTIELRHSPIITRLDL